MTKKKKITRIKKATKENVKKIGPDEKVIDINSFTKSEWNALRLLAQQVKESGTFKGDDFKCVVAAFLIFITEGHFTSDNDYAEDGSFLM